MSEYTATLIVKKWNRKERAYTEFSRRQITLNRRGRYLIANGTSWLSFDFKTGAPTKTAKSLSYQYQLTDIQPK